MYFDDKVLIFTEKGEIFFVDIAVNKPKYKFVIN